MQNRTLSYFPFRLWAGFWLALTPLVASAFTSLVIVTTLAASGKAASLDSETGCSTKTKVSPDLASQLVRQMVRLLEIHTEEQAKTIQQANNRPGGAASLFCARPVDLDRDGQLDLLISQADVEGALCSSHNCPVWVYRRTSNGYKQLLQDFGGYITPIQALDSSTNGYRDIRIQQHSSAIEHEITIYKFNGKQYKAQECITETYVEVKPGQGDFRSQKHRC
jgi:hypothetical protein